MNNQEEHNHKKMNSQKTEHSNNHHKHSENSMHHHHQHDTDEHSEHDMHNHQHHDTHNHGKHKGHGDHHKHMIEDFKKRFWISIVISIPILLLSPLIQQFLGLESALKFEGSKYVSFVLSTFVFFYGGYPFLKGMIDELKKNQPGMMTLIALAISVAYFYSSAVVLGLSGKVFFWELATLIDIMLLGHWIEMKSVMGASNALEELAKLMPSEAHLLKDENNTEDVAVSELKSDDKILIKPGEKIPADGIIIKGHSSLNESMLTGESKPVDKQKEDEVIAGSINGEGSLVVKVEKTGDDSFISQIINLVKEAQASKSKTQNFADKAAFWLTIVAIVSGIITFIVWFLIMNQNFDFALERTVTVMVITCPHALGLAIPLVVAVSTSMSASKGLLIRNRAAFERARNLDAVIFDKTGTLTKGEFGVTDVLVFDENYSDDEILQLAASVENNSEHPIAKGICNSTDKILTSDNFESISGKGAKAEINGSVIGVFSPGYLEEKNINKHDKRIEKLSEEGKTVVYVLKDEKLIGAISLADIIRDESKKAISEFKKLGIKTIMLTGDNKKVGKFVSDELGLDEFAAEILPDEKAKKVKEYQSQGLIVAMTGDGVNDAPALAQADVGIAIGTGTDVAVETADIILVKSNPLDVLSVVKLGKATYKKMLQNLWWATGYNAFAIPLAAGVLFSLGILLSPAVGAVLMSLSTVIVAINAKLLKMEN